MSAIPHSQVPEESVHQSALTIPNPPNPIDEKTVACFAEQAGLIAEIHAQFIQSERKDVSRFNQAASSLSALENLHGKLWTERSDEEARSLGESLKPLRSQVQEMLENCPELTRRDIEVAATFFSKPPEVWYSDETHQERYFQPDHSRPLKWGCRLQMSIDYYESCVLFRQQRHKMPQSEKERNCDILYFKKKKSGFLSIFSKPKHDILSMEERERSSLIELTTSCNYDFYEIFGREGLIMLGFDEKDISGDAVIFYHKYYNQGD